MFALCVLCVAAAPVPAPEVKHRATLSQHTDSIRSLSFSSDGSLLASASDDHTIRIWDTSTGRHTTRLTDDSSAKNEPYWWGTAAFAPRDRLLASGGALEKVKLFDLESQKSKLLLDETRQCPPPWVVFSPDGKTLASGGTCLNSIRLWNVATGKQLSSLVTHEGGNPEGVIALAFTKDGKKLASVSRPDQVMIWDVSSGTRTQTVTTPDRFRCAALSPGAKSVAASIWIDAGDRYLAKDVKIWTASTAREIATLRGHTDDVLALAFTAKGNVLATVGEDKTIRLWECATAKEVATLKGHTAAVTSVAFSPDGKLLASGARDGTIKLWDLPRER